MTKATVKKTGDSSSESADFYGTNAAVLAKGGATLTIKNSRITSNGSNGIEIAKRQRKRRNLPRNK